ncbi:hypothetical protein DPMN_157720 [Dreissena polymorpha]|uniref:Uncharacterized protein n=1 Tax=Dreissena polymorpha TaxID=45954 RepID=A0A9D4EHQ2_DREPO|nr:hypothetical protein DPMN_157720 [Dreissena polymorpha]
MNIILRGNVTESKQTTIRFNVLYGPENMSARYTNMQIHQVLKVIDGWSFEISCLARSNPASVFHWLGPVEQIGNVLSINNVTKDWDRNITCIASNTMVDSLGHSESKLAKLTVFLDVLYPPIAEQKNNQTALLDSSSTLKCNLSRVGNPPATNYTWFRKHSGSIFGTTQQLIINPIALSDEGEYRCNATNLMQPIGNEVVYGFSQATIYVDVQCSPRPSPFSPSTHDLYRAPNESAEFSFTIIAYPEPDISDFKWYKRVNKEWTALLSGDNLNINISANKLQTNLMIPHVQFDDYTVYMLDVSNALGSTAEIFTLHAKSKPDVPTGFNIIRVESNAIDIAWIPGFNGGEVQNFTIRYKEVHSENWKNVYVSSSDLNHTWTLLGLKPNTTYSIKLLAENKIGTSGWTEEITKTTLMGTNTESADNAVKVDSVSLLSAVGGAVGGLFVVVIIVVSILIWIRRLTGKTDAKTGQTGPYDQLAIDVRSNDASLTEGSYATCRNDSSAMEHANTYEKLAETELQGYSSISPFGMQRESTLTSGCLPRLTANIQIVPSSHDLVYENMKL